MKGWCWTERTQIAPIRKPWIPAMVLILLVLPAILFTLAAGCRKALTQEEKLDLIKQKLLETRSFYAVINYHTGNGSGVYTMRQFFKEPSNYRSEIISPEELKGLTTVYNGMNSVTRHPGINRDLTIKSTIANSENKLFLSTFISGVRESENIPIQVETWADGRKYATMELTDIENVRYFTGMKLWVDLETQLPSRLEIKHGGHNGILVEYMEFQFNPDLEDGLFELY